MNLLICYLGPLGFTRSLNLIEVVNLNPYSS
nr:MAG TPA: hypothetical protein [Caudoviricetes sp.]